MMKNLSFKAIGTEWFIALDDGAIKNDTENEVLDHIASFEKHFSRFLPNSEVNAFRNAEAGAYMISEEFAILLKMADRLRNLTHGVYDPAVAGLLERAGYDAKYSMRPSEDVDEFILPRWSLEGKLLTLDGPTAFDLGGIGKGYCIDTVSELLTNLGYQHFLVDAGGDMYATTKRDGSAWNIAIQYPGKPDIAAGKVKLKNQAIAVSDSFRRRWGKWHHLVHPTLKKSIEDVMGAVAVTESAWHADCMTSGLFLAPSEAYAEIAQEFNAKYLVFKQDGTCIVSSNWEGELF